MLANNRILLQNCLDLPSFSKSELHDFLVLEIKGHKISKANYLVLISSKKRTKYLPNSALASIGQSLFFGGYENKVIYFWDFMTFRNTVLRKGCEFFKQQILNNFENGTNLDNKLIFNFFLHISLLIFHTFILIKGCENKLFILAWKVENYLLILNHL